MCLWSQRVVPFQAEEGAVPEQLGQADSQHLFQFLPSLLHLRMERPMAQASATRSLKRAHRAESHLGKDVPPHCFLGPGLVVESSSSLFLGISNHISDDLQRARRRASCTECHSHPCKRKQ